MKKILGSILALSLTISLISCGNTSTNAESSPNEEINNTIKSSTASAESLVESTVLSSNSHESTSAITGAETIIDTSNLEEIKEEYVYPVIYPGVLSETTWTDPNEAIPDSFIGFYCYKTGKTSGTENADTLEKYVQQYFNVSTSTLQKANTYDSTSKKYNLYEVTPGAYSIEVIAASQKDDIITIDYELYSPDNQTTPSNKGKILIDVSGDTVKYKSIIVNSIS